MKKSISILGWGSVTLTIFTLILTLLTTYKFIYIRAFDSYYTLQWCIFFTMMVWAIKITDFKRNIKSLAYSVLCLLIAVGTIFFIFMKVY